MQFFLHTDPVLLKQVVMTQSSKLLYILPECAYAVELLPAKKPNTFTVHTFRQINGNFLDENEFIKDNVEKLVKKFHEESYQLILPDFLFTNTIIDVQSTNQTEVQKHITEKVLPDLQLSDADYYINTFTLTQYQQKSKVQLSALEKSVLVPLTEAAKSQDLHFESVIPLSWTVKAAISLEPSLSTIQMGERLYVALHYIGVDQAIDFAIADTKNIVETIKTLRGAEPSIQTMYLFTNELVENELKEQLSGTLPLQQLGNQVEAHEQMPAYVRFTVETAAKTISIPDFHVPIFSPNQDTKAQAAALPAIQPVDAESSKSPNASENDTTIDKEEMKKDAPIPAPTLPPSKAAKDDAKASSKADKKDEKVDKAEATEAKAEETKSTDTKATTTEITPIEPVSPPAVVAAVAPPAIAAAVAPAVGAISPDATTKDGDKELTPPPSISADSKPAAPVVDITDKILPVTPAGASDKPASTTSVAADISAASTDDDKSSPKVEPVSPSVSGVSAVTPASVTPSVTPVTSVNSSGTPAKESMTDASSSTSPISSSSAAKAPRPVLKKKNDAGDLIKVVFATVTALVVTVAIGVGVGFGLLKLNQKKPAAQTSSPTPAAAASVAPVASTAPVATTSGSTATGSASLVDRAKVKVLVVNATKTAGKAGKTKSTLTTAGYKTVDTGNAKGTYAEAGTYVMISKTAPSGLQAQLAKDLSVQLSTGDQLAAEDAEGKYDAVIVLNE